MKVSVVIPCFNRATYIAETLESAFAQTRAPDEVIVVDDGSTDGSPEVAERFPVRVIRRSQNGGISAALNTGISAAAHPMIALLDSDDLWERDHIEVVGGLLEMHPEAAIAGSAARVFGTLSGVFYPRFAAGAPVDVFDEVFQTWILLPTASVMRRDAVLAVGGYNDAVKRVNDFDLHLRLARRFPFVCTHRITANWRRHDSQISTSVGQQYVDLYECRANFIRTAGRLEGQEAEQVLHAQARDVWRAEVRSAWKSRDAVRFDALREAARYVVGLQRSDTVRWQSQKLLWPVVTRLWDQLPFAVRHAVRGLVK